jgi:hypothetical protein
MTWVALIAGRYAGWENACAFEVTDNAARRRARLGSSMGDG